MAENLLKRSEVPVQDTWKLEDMFESDAAWEKCFEELTKLFDEIPKYAGRLSDPEKALEAMQFVTKAERAASNLYTYARMREVIEDVMHNEGLRVGRDQARREGWAYPGEAARRCCCPLPVLGV